jgi:hypothetical protein
MKFSNFYETKNGVVEPTCKLFQRWKDAGKAVKFLQTDNAGKNKSLQQHCESTDWKFDITCEYMMAMMPQQNHLHKIRFSILANHGHALMAQANIPMKVRYNVWKEAFNLTTLLDSLTVTTINGKTTMCYVHWTGGNPKFVNYLRTWGG